MRSRSFWVCLLAAVSVAVPARAEHTRFWRESNYSEFERGDANGVALRTDGKLLPAPRFAEFSDPNLAYVWTLELDSHGRLYAAGGSSAKVLRFDDHGKASTVFESSDLSAQAIAFDAHDNLYVGTSPDGKVYKVTSDGQKSVFFDPKTKYIWALAIDHDGTMFVATGDTGEIFAVQPDGSGRVFYKTQERHARSLAIDAKGNLLVGTDPNGLVLRIELSHKAEGGPVQASQAFVLYETDKKEVTSLLAAEDGTIYAAGIGEKGRTPNLPPIVSPSAPVSPGAAASQAAAAMIAQGQAGVPGAAVVPFFPVLTGGSEVVRIASDGSPAKLWSSREELAYAMAFSSSKKLLLGTGNSGAIIELDAEDIDSRVAKTASAQVTALLQGPGGAVYVATANPGKIFTLGPGYEKKGSFESEAFDARIFSHWGRLTWWGENGATAGKVQFFVRSGNTSRPEENWSDWAGPYSNASGETVKCPPGRFIQWKAVFADTDSGGPPTISWVSLAYQPNNVAPVIDAIEIQDPGVRVMGFNAQQVAPGSQTPVQLHLPQRASEDGNPNAEFSAPRPQRPEVPPQGFEQKGYQSVLWSAHDDNDDELVFTIYYRSEGEQDWRLLKDKIDQHYYSWDSTGMPDGAYYLKIVASDSPSNPSDQALTGEKETDRFEVSNTPPAVEGLRVEATHNSKGSARVDFQARDEHTDLARAEYSLDSDDWKIIYPVGLLTDSSHETYQLTLHGLSAGEHTIAVRITDRFGNEAAAQSTFTISQ